MIIKFAAENEDAREWEFVPRKVRQSQAEMIEKRAGVGFNEWVQQVQGGHARAWKVLIWHLLCRETGYAVRWEDVPDFAMGEVEIELDLAEWIATREVVRSSPALDEDERAGALAQVDAEIEKRLAAGQVDLGKASSRSIGSATASPSQPTST